MPIRIVTVGATFGAAVYVLYIHGPGVTAMNEFRAVAAIGVPSLVVHLTAGWASRGVKLVATGDNPQGSGAEHRHALQSVTVSEDRDAE